MARSIRIRTLQLHEFSIWIKMRLAALSDSPDAFGDTVERASQRTEPEWRELLLPNEGRLFLAELDGAAVGMCRVARLEDDGSSSGLYSMWVAPTARSAGVGKALVGAALQWAVLAEVKQMILSVTQGNEPAKRVYLAAGFLNTGEQQPLREGCQIQMDVMCRKF